MPQVLMRFSGLVAIVIAWVFLIIPVFVVKADFRKETVTSVAGKSKLLRCIITAGLMGGAAMQALFILYLSDKLLLVRWNLGTILYLSSNVVTVFVALVFYEKHPKLHTFLTRYYFFALPLALLLIGHMLKSQYPMFYMFTIIILVFYAVGQFTLFRKYRIGNVLMEGWGFVILTIWTLVTIFIVAGA